MKDFFKKLTSLIVTVFLVLQPILVIDLQSVSTIPTAKAEDDCQGNPNCTGEYWPDPSANEGNTAESNPDIARAQADREQKDSEAAKKDAENAQKLQEDDKKKCESMLSGGKDKGGALGKAFKNMFTKAASGLLSSQMPPQFKGVFDGTINAAINDPANLGAAMQESLGNSIIAGTNAAFSKNFERAVNQQTNGGQIPLTEAQLRELIQQTLTISTKSALPGATQQAMDKGLAGAIRNTLKTKTPELASGWVQAGTAENFKKNGADELRAQLSGPLFSLLSDHARENQKDAINLNGANAADLQNLANIIIEFIVKSTGDLLEKSTTIPHTVTTYDNEGNVISTTTTQITYESINKKVGEEVFNKFSKLFERRSDGSLTNPEIEQKIADLPIESLINDSGFVNAKQKILANANKNPTNNLNGNLDKLYAAIPFNAIVGGINTSGLINTGGQVNIQKTVEQVMLQFGTTVSSNSGGGGNNVLLQTAISSVGGNLSESVGGFLRNSNGDFTGISESFQAGLSNGLGDMTGNLANGLLDKALGDTPFAGVMDMSFLTDSLGNSVNNLVSGVLENGTFDIGGAFSAGFANFGSGLAEAALGAVLDLAGVPKPIAGLITGIKDTIAGLLIPFVPNREQIGPELTAAKKTAAATGGTQENTSQINQTTRSQEQLDVETCTKLRAIDRKQNAEEQKQKVEDPDLARKAATELEKYRQGLMDWVKKGYDSTGKGPDSPLYVKNTQDQLKQVSEEAKKVYYDNLKNSGDAFKDITLNSLKKNDSKGFSSSITKTTYNQFSNGQIQNSDDWWSAFLAITDPTKPNSPQNSYDLNKDLVNQQQEKARQLATNDLIANQGYLPTRECKEFTSDGQTCKRWEIQTPAIQIKESVAKALASRVDQYLDPKQGFISEGNQPSVEEVRTFTPQTSGGGGSGPGTKSSSSILQTIITFLDNIRIQQQDRGNVSLTYTVTNNNAGSPTSIKLAWQGTNVLACSTDDDWIGQGTIPDFVDIIKKQGESLSSSGSFTLGVPLTFDLRFSRTRASSTPPEQSIAVENGNSSLYSKKILSLPVDIKTGDVLTIRLWPFINNVSTAITVGTDTNQATILSSLAQAIVNTRTSDENPTQKAEFLKYSFTTDQSLQKIIVSPKVTYGVSCVDKQGNNIKKSVTIGG